MAQTAPHQQSPMKPTGNKETWAQIPSPVVSNEPTGNEETLAQTAPPTVSNKPTGNQEGFVTDNNSANQDIVPDSQKQRYWCH